MKRFAKFYVALGAFFGVLSTSLADGAVSQTEFSALLVSGLGALLVFAVPNAKQESIDDLAKAVAGQAEDLGLGLTLDGQPKKHAPQ